MAESNSDTPTKSRWQAFKGHVSGAAARVKAFSIEHIHPLKYRQVWREIEELIAQTSSHTAEPKPTSWESRLKAARRERGLRVFVVDGGGSLGIVPTTILIAIERQIKRLREEAKTQVAQAGTVNRGTAQAAVGRGSSHIEAEEAGQQGASADDEIFLADHVDMFCGTSAGGMISLAHAHGRLKLSAIQKLFESGAAFTASAPRIPLVMDYPVGRLEIAMNHVYKKLIKIDDPESKRLDLGQAGKAFRLEARNLADADERAKRVRPFVFAVTNPSGSLDATLLANYTTAEYARSATLQQSSLPRIRGDITPTEATRATSSAPFYYPPKRLQEQVDGHEYKRYYLDGGLVNNSPVDIAIFQAQMLFGPKRDFDLVVSIGCGVTKEELETQKQGGSSYWRFCLLKRFINAYLVNSVAGFERAQRILHLDPRFNDTAYSGLFRLNPILEKKPAIDCSRKSKLSELREAVEEQCNKGGALYDNIVRIAAILADIESEAPETSAPSIVAVDGAAADTFEEVRHRALTTVRLHPPPSSGNAKDDPKLSAAEWRKLYFGTTEVGSDHDQKRALIHLVELLEACLTETLHPSVWASRMAKTAYGLAKDVEDVRSALLRLVIVPVGVSFDSRSAGQCRAMVETFGAPELLRILTVQVEYDRQNALRVLQYDRQGHDRGKVWATKEKTDVFVNVFKKVADFPRPGNDDAQRESWWGQNQRATVNRNLVSLIQVLDFCKQEMNGDNSQLNDQQLAEFERIKRLALEPEIPGWMTVKYPAKVEELRALLAAGETRS